MFLFHRSPRPAVFVSGLVFVRLQLGFFQLVLNLFRRCVGIFLLFHKPISNLNVLI